jgi:WD40 repeat protein
MAAGFKEGIKIYYLLEDEIKICLELPGKVCNCIKYSNGGHYLAAGNGNVITIIDPYTFEIKYLLHGHPNSLRILNWTDSDSHLISVCNNGSVYGWSSNFDLYVKQGPERHDAHLVA